MRGWALLLLVWLAGLVSAAILAIVLSGCIAVGSPPLRFAADSTSGGELRYVAQADIAAVAGGSQVQRTRIPIGLAMRGDSVSGIGHVQVGSRRGGPGGIDWTGGIGGHAGKDLATGRAAYGAELTGAIGWRTGRVQDGSCQSGGYVLRWASAAVTGSLGVERDRGIVAMVGIEATLGDGALVAMPLASGACREIGAMGGDPGLLPLPPLPEELPLPEPAAAPGIEPPPIVEPEPVPGSPGVQP